jgi:hypothetical protein
VTSSTEAECNALLHTGKENLWLVDFLKGLDIIFKDLPPTIFHQDNTSAITLATKETKNKKRKYFGIEFEAFREYVKFNEISIKYVPTDEQIADMLTKPLPTEKFTYFRDMIMGVKQTQQLFL